MPRKDYNRIAAEFIKEKIVEWGALNYKVREAKHLDIIYECLSENILNYMPEKCQIMRLIRNKRRRLRRGINAQQQQPHQRKFMFSLDEINDYKVAEALEQSHQRLYEYYVKHGIIRTSNPIYNQQQKHVETSDSMIGVTVPEYDSSSSVQTLADASINAECILSHSDSATHEHMPKSSRLEKAINRLYQKQQQQCCCVTNTNDYENLHQSSLGQTYCYLNIDNDMVDYYNFIQSHGFLNAAEASNLNSFLHENRKIQNESPAIYNGNVSSNNIFSMEATENQNLESFITDPTILNILLILDADERRQKLIEYEKKLLPGFEETSKIAKNVLKQCQELLENF
uniref:Uncharacterized protein n=1 Tax=Panagrolaimus davidi TaxID=227884 RepID=A0A914Q9R7_9BILA